MAYSARKCYIAALTELSKTDSPNMLLEEFNYFINKAILLRINKDYNYYNINQLYDDNLRVLKSNSILKVKPVLDSYGTISDISKYGNLFNGIYVTTLPDDYLHILNCICIYRVINNNGCDKKNDYVFHRARRLTSDLVSEVTNNYYNRPNYNNPYYYIHNVNSSEELPTNPDTDMIGEYKVSPVSTDRLENKAGIPELVEKNLIEGTNLNRVIKIKSKYISSVEKQTALRYGNPSKVRCEIRCGNNPNYELESISVDYLKTPQYINLTLALLDFEEDTSLILEFSDDVCLEMINELVILLMNRSGDPRLNSLATVTLSIARPVQQLTNK